MHNNFKEHMKNEMATLERILESDKPYYMNIHPMHLDEEKWELLDNVDCQQITLAVKKFKDS